MTDNQLLSLLEDSPDDVLGQLYERYFDRILQYAYRRTFDRQIAYDITANIFLKVAEKIGSFTPNHEHSFVAWLFRIANNEVVSYYRKPEKYKSNCGLDEYLLDEDEESTGQTEAEFLDTIELYKQLYKAMQHLSHKEQSVVDLFYFEQMSYTDIAHSTGMKQSTVGVLLHRAVGKLRTELRPLVEGDSI